MDWPAATLDHGTFCVSCHTALTYSLARPALRALLAEPRPAPTETALIENATKRVRLWKETGPYYNDRGYDRKTEESRGTESVLNSLILANRDAQAAKLSDDTRNAFENMWALQQTTGPNRGSWSWLQFDQEPWEANDSGYYGATLAAMAVGIAPENYRSTPDVQNHLQLLHEYLNVKEPLQSPLNRVFLLWASTKLPGLLQLEQQKAIIREILSKQQSDGGWRTASLSWRWSGWSLRGLLNMWVREDGTPIEGRSDGVATGLITLVLQEAGVGRDNVQLKRGLEWLLRNQDVANGFWPASSVNKRRHISSETGRFMSDAATAYAVLALTESEKSQSQFTSAASR
jgi:squalene-hopene/tetraprenyl-beta-curcumene cyclase